MADISSIKSTPSPATLQRTSRGGDKGVSRNSENESSNTPSSDTVELTSLSTGLMASARESGGMSSPIDTARVEAIKQAIREGRFKVNPEAVADKLISTVQELVQRKNG